MGSSERQTGAVWLELCLSWQGSHYRMTEAVCGTEARVGAVLWAMDLWKGLRLFYMTIDPSPVDEVHVCL